MQLTTKQKLAGWLYVLKIDAVVWLGFIAGIVLASHITFSWH